MDNEIQVLTASRKELTRHAEEIVSEWDKPLIVQDGKIVQGVYWINADFEYNFWSWRRKKPKPNKCICTCCGNKHNLKA